MLSWQRRKKPYVVASLVCTGDDILQQKGIEIDIYWDIIIIIASSFVIRILSYLSLRYLHKPRIN